MSQEIQTYSELMSEVALSDSFIRQKNLLQQHVPFSAATLWRLVNAGKFPKPLKVTDQITAWRISDIKDWAKDPAGYATSTEGSE